MCRPLYTRNAFITYCALRALEVNNETQDRTFIFVFKVDNLKQLRLISETNQQKKSKASQMGTYFSRILSVYKFPIQNRTTELGKSFSYSEQIWLFSRYAKVNINSCKTKYFK